MGIKRRGRGHAMVKIKVKTIQMYLHIGRCFPGVPFVGWVGWFSAGFTGVPFKNGEMQKSCDLNHQAE